MPRLLLATTQAPASGGSGTAGYDLFRRLLGDHLDVHYLNLIGGDDHPRAADLSGNPRALQKVWDCQTPHRMSEPQPELTRLLTSIAPDVAVGLGFQAATRLKLADPDACVVLLTGTCRQAQDFVTLGYARDAVSLGQDLEARRLRPKIVNGAERKAFEICDLVVTHSRLTMEMVGQFYPAHAGKVYPQPISYAEWIADGASAGRHHIRPFNDRDIDALFVSSDWSRAEKGFDMLRSIAREVTGLRVHVTGHVPREVNGVTHDGFVGDRDALFALMGRARAVVCPSTMDAAPGVLFEAAVLGCNVVASRNCGNWDLCHPDLLVESYSADSFVAAIERAAARKYPDQLQRILDRGSYRELVALLMAFARPFKPEPVG